ncbi:uncharacterized protein LOC129749226 [Uranotaenia lowii]|uniref:uncharacterized protein LOC129749226 n=1 Tax=Uranotaenia lowii TaxID=190385 RepID=UPI00247AD71A|nr:uncharacterized protein LOC129749226 [Uranotaenia lowii]
MARTFGFGFVLLMVTLVLVGTVLAAPKKSGSRGKRSPQMPPIPQIPPGLPNPSDLPIPSPAMRRFVRHATSHVAAGSNSMQQQQQQHPHDLPNGPPTPPTPGMSNQG